MPTIATRSRIPLLAIRDLPCSPASRSAGPSRTGFLLLEGPADREAGPSRSKKPVLEVSHSCALTSRRMRQIVASTATLAQPESDFHRTQLSVLPGRLPRPATSEPPPATRSSAEQRGLSDSRTRVNHGRNQSWNRQSHHAGPRLSRSVKDRTLLSGRSPGFFAGFTRFSWPSRGN